MEIKNFIVSNGIISQTAFIEAQEVFASGTIPSNFSNDLELQAFTLKSLEDGRIDLEMYNTLVSKLDLTYLEYDEAVLLGVLELIALSK